MKLANIAAWLTCLLLILFIGILSVRNTAGLVKLERKVRQMEQENSVTTGKADGGDTTEAQLKRIRRSLGNILDEVKSLRVSAAAAEQPELRARLEEMESALSEVSGKLGSPEQPEH